MRLRSRSIIGGRNGNESCSTGPRSRRVDVKPATLRAIAAHQVNLVRVLDLKEGDCVGVRRIEAGIRQWSLRGGRGSRLAARPLSGRRLFHHAERWLRFLGWLEEPEAVCHAHAREVAVFAARMRSERGWSDATIEGCCRTADRFFDWLDERGVDLESVGIGMIDEAVARYRSRGFSSSSTSHDAGCAADSSTNAAPPSPPVRAASSSDSRRRQRQNALLPMPSASQKPSPLSPLASWRAMIERHSDADRHLRFRVAT